jgi:hypothetical protein
MTSDTPKSPDDAPPGIYNNTEPWPMWKRVAAYAVLAILALVLVWLVDRWAVRVKQDVGNDQPPQTVSRAFDTPRPSA